MNIQYSRYQKSKTSFIIPERHHRKSRPTSNLGMLILFVFFIPTFILAQIPTITSFSPTSGPIGTTVTITGANFNTTAENNVVYFGAVKATIISASSTSLTVTVPTGITYQPITVTDITTGLTAYSAKPFIITFAGGGSITSTSFAAKVDNGTGNTPEAVAI
ncbi:MAG: IPT/TIG domain-containing protein, partial [Candidatus Marinimicrobia bacterium]|nr:IPT/TIG domain-containing protein [Candidatus Neomarinimicrobiota bacterium]